LRAPLTYQDIDGTKHPIPAGYILTNERQVGFNIGAYDVTSPLIIDPVLVYSSYLGGTSSDRGNHIAVDGAGTAYVTGETNSDDFPTLGPLQGARAGGTDAFVAKVNATGTGLVYSTYFGGSGDDVGSGISVDGAGNAYVIGFTNSVDFPTASPLQAVFGGGSRDAFVAKLDPPGTALSYSTYLGGSAGDFGDDIAVDGGGNAYVTGLTASADFPTANPLQAVFGGGSSDAFVAKVNPIGPALEYSTYLGGSGTDDGNGIAMDGSGSAYVTGDTTSDDFPTVGAIQAARAGITDAFVSKVNALGSALVYSTYLGGSSSDEGRDIAVDSSGNAYVTGFTGSADFPVANASQAFLKLSFDVFLTKINPAGASLVFSTYFDLIGSEIGFGIAVDSSENVYVAGQRITNSFGIIRHFAIVSEFNAAGVEIDTLFLVSDGMIRGASIALDSAGNMYVTGFTESGFTTKNPFQANHAGSFDAFVTKAQRFLAFLSGGGDDGGEGGCFIATAAYGSTLAPQVQLLREFRDRYLLTNGPGRAFVTAYYRLGPPLAELIRQHKALGTTIRVALWPVIWWTRLALAWPAVAFVLSAGGLVAGLSVPFLLLRVRRLRATANGRRTKPQRGD
jgi:hypothetical protein